MSDYARAKEDIIRLTEENATLKARIAELESRHDKEAEAAAARNAPARGKK
jgi:BMFP domain-containing protein YqiC